MCANTLTQVVQDTLGVLRHPLTPRTPGGGGGGQDDAEAVGGVGRGTGADIDKDMMNNMNSFSFAEEGKKPVRPLAPLALFCVCV